jgi:predicted nicotinamide N-methyase
MVQPTAPTASLPALGRLSSHCHADIAAALENLRELYFPTKPTVPIPIPAVRPSKLARMHTFHDGLTPDSGYASGATSATTSDTEDDEDEEDADTLEIMRVDAFERAFAIRWLTGFTSRVDTFLYPPGLLPDAEYDARSATLDVAATLLAALAGVDSEAEDAAVLVRSFAFPAPCGREVRVCLTDAALPRADHTAVGLQSWASAVVLARRLCADPAAFGLGAPTRVLELGAGTGLLSIAAAQLFAGSGSSGGDIVATDFHPDVLANLADNVAANCPGAVHVCALDWAYAARDCAERAPLAAPFSVVLAADVVYAPAHARWLHTAAARVLAPEGVFWMVLARRATGRHEGLVDAVDYVFPAAERVIAGTDGGDGAAQLAVLAREDLERVEGCGRADEGGYRLYKIGWVAPRSMP